MDHIIAVRLVLASGDRRYFLTWGRLGRNDPWPGDIERAVLKASAGWAINGTPVSAHVCDSLQEASAERYFHECLISMQHVMPPPVGKAFQRWADKVSAAVLRGQELYFLGLPKEMEDLEVDPNAAHGFLLECFGEDGYLVAEHDLEGMTVERVQEILDDDDADRVMVLSHPVSGDMLAAVVADRDIAVDEGRYEYFVSGWADRGYRTPRGYYPPPRSLPAYPDAEKVRPPKTSG